MPTDQNERPITGPEHQLTAPQPRQHKFAGVIVWIVLLLVFAAAFYLVLHKHEDSAANARAPRGGGGPATVVTATAQKGDIGIYLDSIGTVTPIYTSSITSQVNGIVTAVHYKEGQIVRKGDALIDIDDRSYRATLLQAQGTLDRDEGHDRLRPIDRSARRRLGPLAAPNPGASLAKSYEKRHRITAIGSPARDYVPSLFLHNFLQSFALA